MKAIITLSAHIALSIIYYLLSIVIERLLLKLLLPCAFNAWWYLVMTAAKRVDI